MSKRLYPHNRVRYWYAYDLDELCALFKDTGLHVQTVRKWINKDGLKTIDKGKPTLIYGHDLIDFLKRQNSNSKCKTPFDQMYCMKCQDARHVLQNKIAIESKNRFLKVCGLCRVCKIHMFKSYKMEVLQELKRIYHTVDVSQLYDCLNPTDKTHIQASIKTPASELFMRDLFDE